MKSVDQKQVCFQKVSEPANEQKSALLISQISVGAFLTARVAERQKTFFPHCYSCSVCLPSRERECQCEKELCIYQTVTHGVVFGTSFSEYC